MNQINVQVTRESAVKIGEALSRSLKLSAERLRAAIEGRPIHMPRIDGPNGAVPVETCLLEDSQPRGIVFDYGATAILSSREENGWLFQSGAWLKQGPKEGKQHALQRLAEQPSPFGQSMWRPWEK